MAKFLILVDRPAVGDKDSQLKDGNGRYVWHLLFKAQAPMEDLAVEFLLDENGHSRWRSIETKHKPTVVVAMGQAAADEFLIDGKVFKTRGSVYDRPRRTRKMYVIPTFHPKELKKPYNMFADESLERGFYTLSDIRKAVRVYREGWPKQVERFNLEPTVEDVRAFVDMALTDKVLLGCDLETTGLSIEHKEIVVHGFAWTEEDAIVIPETGLHGERYWSPEDWTEVSKLLARIYTEGKLMYQNGVGFDIPFLRARGWDVDLDAYVEETMIKSHTLNPETPNNIGFISSIYGRTPYWKDSFLNKKVSIHETDQLEMRAYNARDCIVLHQINNSMNQHIAELVESSPIWRDLPEIYLKGMEAARVVIEMQAQGIALDPKKLTVWHKYVEKELTKTEGLLTGLYELPETFNLSSGDHLRWLLYGEKPKAWGKKYEDEAALYNTPAFNLQYTCKVCSNKITKKTYDVPGSREFSCTERVLKCSKCKTERLCIRTDKEPTSVKGKDKKSKKYAELLNIAELMKVEPLYKLRGYVPPTTKKGDASATDKKALVRYLISLDNRLSQLASMKRRRPPHDIEEAGLKRTKEYIVALQQYIKIYTLRKSFWDFPTWRDHKVRPSFLVTGTATGRFSCKNPNLMQVPRKGDIGSIIRSCFRADKGSLLLSSDWSNLEVQIGARIFGDEALIKMLEAGINMHDENTRIFFGIEMGDPSWDKLRRVSKIIMFGRLLYGGSDAGIYSQVMTAVPDCGLTLPMFKEAVQNYFKAHPAFAEWMYKVQKLATDEKISINAFGRVRSLLGPLQSIKRQALNSPIQGSAADMMRDTMILIQQAFKANNLKSKMIIQIHDELLFNTDEDELKIAGTIIRDVMTRKLTINGYTFRIPIDAEIGTYWGDLKSINLKTFEISKGSKH